MYHTGLPPFSVSIPGSCKGDFMEISDPRDFNDMSDPLDLRDPLDVPYLSGGASPSRWGRGDLEACRFFRAWREVSGSSVASMVASEMRVFMLLILSFTDMTVVLARSLGLLLTGEKCPHTSWERCKV